MNGCIYRTKDGECDLYAEGGKFTAFCEMENCAGRKMSNADGIRAMSDEDLMRFLLRVGTLENRPWCDDEPCNNRYCSECITEWLKEEVSE